MISAPTSSIARLFNTVGADIIRPSFLLVRLSTPYEKLRQGDGLPRTCGARNDRGSLWRETKRLPFRGGGSPQGETEGLTEFSFIITCSNKSTLQTPQSASLTAPLQGSLLGDGLPRALCSLAMTGGAFGGQMISAPTSSIARLFNTVGADIIRPSFLLVHLSTPTRNYGKGTD